ncbi:hypothetical protein ACFE04_026949 [Oxalis oulophora]
MEMVFEIQWSDIMGLKANFSENEPATLNVVLARQPLFFRETNPQPRNYTLWQATADFTNGQASIHRTGRFVTRVPPLDELIEAVCCFHLPSAQFFPVRNKSYFICRKLSSHITLLLLKHLKLIREKSIVKAMVVMKMVVMASVSDDCRELEPGETQYLFLRLWYFDVCSPLFLHPLLSSCSEFRLLCVEVRLQTGRLMDFQRLRSEVVKKITMGLGIILGMVDVGLAEEEWLHFIKIPHGQAVLHPEQDEVFTIHESAKFQEFHDYYKFKNNDVEQRDQALKDAKEISGEGTIESMLHVEKALRELAALKVQEAVGLVMANRRCVNSLKAATSEKYACLAWWFCGRHYFCQEAEVMLLAPLLPDSSIITHPIEGRHTLRGWPNVLPLSPSRLPWIYGAMMGGKEARSSRFIYFFIPETSSPAISWQDELPKARLVILELIAEEKQDVALARKMLELKHR